MYSHEINKQHTHLLGARLKLKNLFDSRVSQAPVSTWNCWNTRSDQQILYILLGGILWEELCDWTSRASSEIRGNVSNFENSKCCPRLHCWYAINPCSVSFDNTMIILALYSILINMYILINQLGLSPNWPFQCRCAPWSDMSHKVAAKGTLRKPSTRSRWADQLAHHLLKVNNLFCVLIYSLHFIILLNLEFCTLIDIRLEKMSMAVLIDR
jgi:hypothetical protein